jgi:hypothetical protein
LLVPFTPQSGGLIERRNVSGARYNIDLGFFSLEPTSRFGVSICGIKVFGHARTPASVEYGLAVDFAFFRLSFIYTPRKFAWFEAVDVYSGHTTLSGTAKAKAVPS